MFKKLPPVEIAGYLNRRVWTVDCIRRTADFRWYSVKNTDHADEDYLPWDGDSKIDPGPDDCPF